MSKKLYKYSARFDDSMNRVRGRLIRDISLAIKRKVTFSEIIKEFYYCLLYDKKCYQCLLKKLVKRLKSL